MCMTLSVYIGMSAAAILCSSSSTSLVCGFEALFVFRCADASSFETYMPQTFQDILIGVLRQQQGR